MSVDFFDKTFSLEQEDTLVAIYFTGRKIITSPVINNSDNIVIWACQQSPLKWFNITYVANYELNNNPYRDRNRKFELFYFEALKLSLLINPLLLKVGVYTPFVIKNFIIFFYMPCSLILIL